MSKFSTGERPRSFPVVLRVTRGSINGVVVTIPAYFNDSQQQATKDGGAYHHWYEHPPYHQRAYRCCYRLQSRQGGERRAQCVHLRSWWRNFRCFSLDCQKFKLGRIFSRLRQPPVTLTWMVMTFITVSLTTSSRNSSARTRRVSIIVNISALIPVDIDLSTNPHALRRLRTACERGINFISVLTRVRFEDQCGDLFRTPSSLSRSFLSAAPLVLAVS
jgi:hypothetical protein